MQGVEVATRFSSILSVWNREDKHREPGPNPASPHKLQLFIPRFHAILYRVHGMEPEHFARGEDNCAFRGCTLALIPWSYGRGTIYRADWNSISASSCLPDGTVGSPHSRTFLSSVSKSPFPASIKAPISLSKLW